MTPAPSRLRTPSRARHRAPRRRSLLHWASACMVVAAGAAGIAGAGGDGAGSAQATSSSAATVPPLVAPDAVPTLEDPRQLAGKKRRALASREHRERLDRRTRAARAAERSRLAAMDPRDLARSMARARGWGAAQFRCLDLLWARESGWNRSARNPSSGAFGIPQALPGAKMASAGKDWRTNPVTQIRWGLQYIGASYGSPCSAWGHSQSYGWY